MGQLERKIAQYNNSVKELLDMIFRRWVHEHKFFVQQVSLYILFFFLCVSQKLVITFPTGLVKLILQIIDK